MTSKVVSLLDLEDIKDVVQAVVREELLRHNQSSHETPFEELMTIKETAELLRVSTVTIWAWSKRNVLKKHSIFGNPRYKRSEVMEALTLMESNRKVA